ncbi:hypothetical protein DL766_010458 [Monosporascus sp. MC13-8B]|uniref:Uncharacterized protein n=1 Tax=Monosporascus cannonballus TaxID=155416 RepID=A0ABY0GX58_9PEZI|nr:hypothetical protein DL762_008109 [Monosporascus cannonballus]RYO81955.1 hypothetical protein DL763_008406 [Monosporascus cannonballus]RYP01812.1 hypothetical protein DL766_010458 [Monosporascus sp. MC13-8B]
MQFSSTILLTTLGGHAAALPANTLLSLQRTEGLTVTIRLSSVQRRDERQGLDLTQRNAQFVPAGGEDDSLTGVSLEPSSNLAKFVECVALGWDELVVGSLASGRTSR